MIISDREIDKCLQIITAGQGGEGITPSSLKPAERALLDAYRRRLEEMPEPSNRHVHDVKAALDEHAYEVGSADVAEKILGRVISDKVR